MKNKHYDMIVEWATTGREVQGRPSPGYPWINCDPVWVQDWEYRFKPEVIRSRRYVWKGKFRANVTTVMQDDRTPNIISEIEKDKDFIRWIDITWQEHEI